VEGVVGVEGDPHGPGRPVRGVRRVGEVPEEEDEEHEEDEGDGDNEGVVTFLILGDFSLLPPLELANVGSYFGQEQNTLLVFLLGRHCVELRRSFA